jgi:exopolysaccharide biosynthesis protein
MINSYRNTLTLLFGRIIIFGLVCLILQINPVYASKSSITYTKRIVSGVPAHIVTINLKDPDVRLSPMMPRFGVGHSEPWAAMINRARPTAAITGTFFDTRSLHPIGDIVVDGDLKCQGTVGTAIGIGANNEVRFIPTKRGKVNNWSEYQHVIVAGPMLIWNSKQCVYPRAQGFKDRQLFAKRPRTAVGITKNNKLLMVAVTKSVYLSKLAKMMRSLGAINAAALDGGSSTALYYRGKSVVKPGRQLTNLLVAYDSTSRHEEVRYLLAPDTNRLTKKPNATER